MTGIICHIKGRNKRGPRYDSKQTEQERHAFANLVLLCTRHSKVIDTEVERFPVELLQEIKAIHEREGAIEISRADSMKAELLLDSYRGINIKAGGHVMLNSPGSVQGDQIVIKSSKKTVKILPPGTSIASQLSKRNYVKYLIDRYHEFASKQSGRTFGYPAIYAEIKKRFGAKWDLVRLGQFADLTGFLQGRVDNTMLGRINRSKGVKSYSSYEEFLEKFGYENDE